MKLLKTIAPIVMIGLLMVASAEAQKKSVKKAPVKKTATTTPQVIVPPLEVRTARDKVTTQYENINLFIDKLGPIAQDIEAFDESTKTKKPTARATEMYTGQKERVVEAIRNLKVGLTSLEAEFRTKPLLTKYLPNVQGITDLGAAAEDAALAGRFVASKEPLRNISRKLMDTLAVMPK